MRLFNPEPPDDASAKKYNTRETDFCYEIFLPHFFFLLLLFSSPRELHFPPHLNNFSDNILIRE